MTSPIYKKSNLDPSLQPQSEKTLSNFWKTVRTNIELQHQAPPIKPVPRSRNLPLSFAQERLWFFDQLQPRSSIHNMCAAFRLKGSLNVAILEKSLKAIVRRHEILRTTFPSVDGQPVLLISSEINLKLPVIDLRELPETEREAEAQRFAIADGDQPFDLNKGPLMRVKLLRLAEEEYWLLRIVHHIVFDGWSYMVFMRELAIFYEAFSDGKPSPLPELPIQYADFAQSQRQWLQGKVIESLLNYWKQQLNGSIPALELPIDHPRPTVPNYQGASQSLVLSKNLTTTLKKLSAEEGVSLFVTLLAAFKTLLHRYTGQEDIILCSPVAGRNRIEIKRLIGYFNNLVVIRTDLSGNPSFRELMGQVSQVVLEAHKHQDLPFQKLVEFPNLARIPLNRGMFVLQNAPPQPQEVADITFSPLDLNWETTNFDLSLSMHEKGEELSGLLCYKTELFDDTTITQMQKHFQTLLETLVANPDQRLKDLPFLNPKDKVDLHILPAPDQIRQEPEETFVVPRDELELQLTKIWEQVLDIQPISVKDNFFALGGNSLLAVRLFAQIEKRFGKNLPLAILFQAPTVEQLAGILCAQGWKVPESSIVAIQLGGSKPPFFFINSISYAKVFGPYLGFEQPFYCLNIFGLTGLFEKQLPHLQIEEIAEQFIKDMRSIQPAGPYFLGTYCGDSQLTLEMAQQLHQQGEKVAMLAFIDVIWDAPDLGLYLHWYNLCQFGPNYLIEKAKHRFNFIKYKFVILTKSIKGKFYSRTRHTLPRNLQDVNLLEAFYQARAAYVPQVYPGQLTLFLSSEWRLKNSPKLESLAGGGLEIQEIPGYHHSMFEEPQIQVLAKKLRICIDKAIAESLSR